MQTKAKDELSRNMTTLLELTDRLLSLSSTLRNTDHDAILPPPAPHAAQNVLGNRRPHLGCPTIPKPLTRNSRKDVLENGLLVFGKRFSPPSHGNLVKP